MTSAEKFERAQFIIGGVSCSICFAAANYSAALICIGYIFQVMATRELRRKYERDEVF